MNYLGIDLKYDAPLSWWIDGMIHQEPGISFVSPDQNSDQLLTKIKATIGSSYTLPFGEEGIKMIAEHILSNDAIIGTTNHLTALDLTYSAGKLGEFKTTFIYQWDLANRYNLNYGGFNSLVAWSKEYKQLEFQVRGIIGNEIYSDLLWNESFFTDMVGQGVQGTVIWRH
ncbi:hypothetical protein [Algivirga pacifica]|uniref:Uncharacterized protein n=1 Tax=Algivirga pacifica TaxID=1162670 RepID=A0ABP9DCS4_9BACT